MVKVSEAHSNSWTDQTFDNKLNVLRRFCVEENMPLFFPKNVMQFCEWVDEENELTAFTRPIFYRKNNSNKREEAVKLMLILQQRFSGRSEKSKDSVVELENLIKLLTSSYQHERQARIDLEVQVSSLRASVDSLSARIVELTNIKNIKLVK